MRYKRRTMKVTLTVVERIEHHGRFMTRHAVKSELKEQLVGGHGHKLGLFVEKIKVAKEGE